MRLVIGGAVKGHTPACISLCLRNIFFSLDNPELQTIGQGDTFIFLTCCDGLNGDKDELFKDCINKHLGPGFGYIVPFVLRACCCLKRASSRNVPPLVRNTFGWRIQRAGFQMAGAAPTSPCCWLHRGRWQPQHPGRGASEK